MFDWNDLQAFLATARAGSTLSASRSLGVNQTTVARRIEALEKALNVRLFERGQSGSRLTEAGRDLVSDAEQVERMAENFAARASAHRRDVAGTIRVTTSEIVASSALTPAIAMFRTLHPEVNIDLVITDRVLDIRAGEADVAVRTAYSLEASDLIARKLADYDFALFCSQDYAQRRGAPTLVTLAQHDLIAGDMEGRDLPGMAWMFAQAGGRAPAMRLNSMSNLVHAVQAGLGVSPLPCVLADGDLRMLRCSEVIEEARSASWLVTRRDLKDTPRIRLFIDFLAVFYQRDLPARRARAKLDR